MEVEDLGVEHEGEDFTFDNLSLSSAQLIGSEKVMSLSLAT